jgi:hypothetical protein
MQGDISMKSQPADSARTQADRDDNPEPPVSAPDSDRFWKAYFGRQRFVQRDVLADAKGILAPTLRRA